MFPYLVVFFKVYSYKHGAINGFSCHVSLIYTEKLDWSLF